MGTVLAALSTAAGLLATFTVLGFTLAGSANSTPEALQRIKLFMICFSIGAFISLIGGIVLIVKGLPGWAALVGGLPVLFVVCVIIWLVASELF